jgi:DNA-binding NtrC family response regulator
MDERELAQKNALQKFGMADLIGQAPAFLEAVGKIPLVADCDATVLITGETGVGKEVCARAVHYLSKRAGKPFVPVNCGAIPTNLVENELFGHRKGAFTDAHGNQQGLLAEAEGGTLFLDEIDSLPLEAQSKMLRLLQDKTYRPLGETKSVRADIRIIAATNADLRQKAQAGAFRMDLFYRFNFTLLLPPLRERRTDVPVLAEYFLDKHGKEYERGKKTLSPAARQKLTSYHWPGNIRELQNIIQQAILLTPEATIPAENINLPVTVRPHNSQKLSYSEAKRKVIEEFEKSYITQLLISSGGNITRASSEAGKDRKDISRLVKKHNIDPKALTFSFV